jgi:hypothetical protein
MKKRKNNPSEKREQNQSYGVLWTTASVIHMFRDLQQQHVFILNTYHYNPTDFISSAVDINVKNITY